MHLRTRIHNHLTPSERVFCRPAALKNLAIHKVLSAFFRLAGQQNPSPIRHPLIMNTGSKFYAIFCSGLGAGASRRLTYVRRCGGSQKIAGSRGSETASVWFQTKLTGARRPPRGFSGFQPPVSWADFFSSQFKVLLNFFQKIAGSRGSAPAAARTRRNTPSWEAHFEGELALIRSRSKEGAFHLQKAPSSEYPLLRSNISVLHGNSCCPDLQGC